MHSIMTISEIIYRLAKLSRWSHRFMIGWCIGWVFFLLGVLPKRRMKGPYLRVLPAFLILHSFSVTFFYPRLSPFLIQLQINTNVATSSSSSAHNRVYARRVDSSTLVFSLSSHRNPYIVFVFSSRFNDS